MVQWFKASNEPEKYCPIFKYYMFYITERTQLARPGTVADKHKQNINLLLCVKYRGDEALSLSNANNKGWKNFNRLTIILLIHEFTKWKFYHIKISLSKNKNHHTVMQISEAH